MLDEYIIGEHKRNSPEADVPVILSTKRETRLGGAANVAMNMKPLGLNPILLSAIADDDAGKAIIKLCQEADIDMAFINTVSRATTIKQRIVDKDYKQYLRVDHESTEPLPISEETALILTLKQVISKKTIAGLVIQDYNKGVLTPYVIKNIKDLCEQNAIPIFVDPKHDNFLLLADCTLFKPNLKELSTIAGKNLAADPDALIAVLKELNLPSEYVFVTLADKGILGHAAKENKSHYVEGIPLVSADVSGAGDTVLAVLVWAYLMDLGLPKMAELANKAGAAVCQKSGVSVVSATDLQD